MDLLSLLLLLLRLSSSQAQQVGTQTDEKPVPFSIKDCGSDADCQPTQGGLTIDANWRWTHKTDSNQNCYTGNTWDSTICSSGDACAQNCALDGAKYQETYGVAPSGQDGVTLKYVTKNENGENYGSRLYLLDSSGDKYHMFKLKNRQFSFDVDVSQLPCGLNGALYFSAMPEDGGMSKSPNNKAGAKYGLGYCDAQCPRDIKWIDGKANSEGWQSGDANGGQGKMGSCCPEMDVWEANSISQAFTPHTCHDATQTTCTDDQCGDGDGNRYKGLCDKDGCDFASYRWGAKDFYGKGMKVDSSQKFTVITQFVTQGNTDDGDLIQINRFYVQNGQTIANAPVTIQNTKPTASLTDDFCKATKAFTGDTDSFSDRGGLKSMGAAMDNGMVLVMSIWDDGEAKMQWLDGTYPPTKSADAPGVLRGTCDKDSGDPQSVRQSSPDASVTFSNVKIGAIDQTLGGDGSGSPHRRYRRTQY